MAFFGTRCTMLRCQLTVLLLLGWLLACHAELENQSQLVLGDSEQRKLRAVPNAFAIVQEWMIEYEESEERTHEIVVMDPTDHVLYGRSVPIATSPPNIETYIVGGQPTATAASWMVMLLHWNPEVGLWQFAGCSGTLIASKYVLTAAHCVNDRLTTPVTWNAVYVQAFAPFHADNGGLDAHFSFVKSFDIHAEYTSTRFDMDVALIELAKPVDTSDFMTLRLAENGINIENDDLVTMYGFGMTEEEAEEHSNVLREVDVPFVSAETCRQYHGYQITDDMVCAGLQQGGKDACNGDSGGPLVRKLAQEVYQVGIVSWGDGCARANSPGVYTSVPYFYRWIADRVCADLDMQVELIKTLCRTETSDPTEYPTASPTQRPSSANGTSEPSFPLSPTLSPELFLQESDASAQISPTTSPTGNPGMTSPPSNTPTVSPAADPISATTNLPTESPVSRLTGAPSTRFPTQSPVYQPTGFPSHKPTRSPVALPTRSPTRQPPRNPTRRPTAAPHSLPTVEPTGMKCLSMDARCFPESGPPCCNGSCVEWRDDTGTQYTCFVSGKKHKSKKKKSKSENNRRG